ncbi:TVP38/TMEM64 family protein [Tepidiforma sp.]|uniref:TVP38/TMEM64 family protein n=1 Tax=Tepidiforma sp. TaxID=2682230 RepID=UPI002ADE57A6|nr:TVP38/TMEM64 family protein [Tepidiforma sp.]
MRDRLIALLAVAVGGLVLWAGLTWLHSRSVAVGLAMVAAYLTWGELMDLWGSARHAPARAPGSPLLADPKFRRRVLGVLALGGASGVVLLGLLTGDIDVEKVREWIRDLGAWGPILLILVLAVAMVIAPIPNPPFMIAAGIAWGTFLGVVYAVIGQLLGSVVIFAISRRFGRRFIPRLIGEEGAERVDRLAKEMGPHLVFWWRMMPVSFDFAAYAAGLTGMSFRLFVVLVFLGSLVPTTVVVAFGDSFGKSLEAQLVSGLLILVALAVPSTIFYLRYRRRLPPPRQWIERMLSAGDPAGGS